MAHLRERALASLAATALALACASPSYDYAPEPVELEEPPIGIEARAFIGETLLSRGSYLEHDAIRVIGETRIGWVRGQTVSPGIYVKFGEDDDTGFYGPSKTSGAGVEAGLLGGEAVVLQAWRDGSKLCVVTDGGGRVCSGSAVYQHLKQSITHPASFRQQLVYQGRVGSQVKLEYQEFRKGSTHVAHREPLEFDLRKSAKLEHKGARLEVLEAGDHSITYQVLSNFTPSE